MKFDFFYPVSPIALNQGFGVNGAYYQANGINIKGHNGLDLRAFHGQPVYAAHDGIAYYETDDKAGQGVVIVSDAQYDAPVETNVSQCFYKTIYWHLCNPISEPQHASPIFKALGGSDTGKGVPVKAGDLIGFADTTGFSSGDHLHFGLKPIKSGTPLPDSWMDAPDVFIGNWQNLEDGNGYLGAIDPTSYFNGFYAQNAQQVIGIYEKIIALCRQLLLKLQNS